MSHLSNQPYKGTRDYYPEDKRIQNYIFATWKRVAEAFGYEEYGAPLLEPLDIYAAKTGQEIVNEQTYTFTDRGERTVAIRPEMTPTVSRMISRRQQETGFPARWYSIANFMRYERPQRGREREFWQLNADIFGVDSIEADAEIIKMADAIMKAFGASSKMYTIRVNDRNLINHMMHDYLGLNAVQAELMIKLFDRKDKITHEEFRDQAYEIFGEEMGHEGVRKISRLLSAKTMAELPDELQKADALRDINKLFALLAESKVTNAAFDISLMRGFDYYTGMVFEVFDNHPDNNRAMFGGGRYDGLVGLFGGEKVPTVGMAPGATTTEVFLQSHGLMPKFTSTTDIYMVVLGDSLNGAQKIADTLREEGVRVAVDITGRKLDKQMKAGIKMNVPFLMFVGEKELTDEVYKLKDVASEDEQTLSLERIVTTVEDHRRRDQDDIV